MQLFEIRKTEEREEGYCLMACNNNEKETDVIVYTEHIFKLYEQNPKVTLDEKDQLTIFKGIVEGAETLALKFGEFVVTKDMVGYNASKRGKAWIN